VKKRKKMEGNTPFKKSAGGKMRRKRRIAITATVLAFAVLIMPASAYYNWFGFPMQGEASNNAATAYNGTVANGTVNGSVYIGCGHGIDYAPYTQEFNVPEGTVKFAHLYVHVWHGTENYQGKLKVNYTNASGTYTLFANNTDAEGNLTLGGDQDTNDNVWTATHGNAWVWFDVKDYVTSGANSATAYTYKVSPGFDGRVGAIKLVVVYENTSMNETRYWIVQGHDAVVYATSGHSAKDYGYAYFNGTINPDEWEYAMLYCTWLAGDVGDTDTLWFNGHLLDDSCTNYEQGAYLDSRWYVVKNDTINYLVSNDNYARYWRDGDAYVHWVDADLVLFREAPRPDLVVREIADPKLVDHDLTHGIVVGHNYVVNATIVNQGTGDTKKSFNATLYENNVAKQTVNVAALEKDNSTIVSFNWCPSSNGTVTLKVIADSLGEINESEETNNLTSKVVYVYPYNASDPDLVMTADDLVFLPAYAFHTANNDTRIRINVTNNGTGDASNFWVRVYDDSTEICNRSMGTVAAKGGKVIYCDYDAPYGGPYPIKVVLDADGEVNEPGPGHEGNNETTKDLSVITVKIWDSHHYGNTSTYNGPESNYQDVAMFSVVKLVPQNTTAWDALNSVANVTPHFGHPEETYVFGIDGLLEDPKGPIYWYLYLNGRYVPNNKLCGVIKLQDGETVHWDFQKHIYGETESYTPPCTVQSYVAGDDLYPEPFKHGFPMGLASGDGYSRTIWNTTIVYPAESPEYRSIAEEIKDYLNDSVPDEKISIADDTSVSAAQKENNNLILLGTYTANDIIDEINPYHEYFGMVIYNSSCKLFDDSADNNYTHGAVVQAFDNPYDNGDLGTNYSWNMPGPVILMASGLNEGDAKDATNLLIDETDELNRFWRIKQAMCGDVDASGGAIDIQDVRAVFDAMFGGSLDSEWAADVDCSCSAIDIQDVRAVFDAMFGGELDCCTGCRCVT